METHSPPTYEVGGSNPKPYEGQLIVAYRWSAVYSTEPVLTLFTGFFCPQNHPLQYYQFIVENNVKPEINTCKYMNVFCLHLLCLKKILPNLHISNKHTQLFCVLVVPC